MLSAIGPRPDPLPGSGKSGETAGELQAAATRFEALVLAQMLKSARAARLGDGPLAGASSDWQSMADEALAGLLARSSPLGLCPMLVAGIERRASPPDGTATP